MSGKGKEWERERRQKERERQRERVRQIDKHCRIDKMKERERKTKK